MQASIWHKPSKLKPWFWAGATAGGLGVGAIAYMIFMAQPRLEINLEKDTQELHS